MLKFIQVKKNNLYHIKNIVHSKVDHLITNNKTHEARGTSNSSVNFSQEARADRALTADSWRPDRRRVWISLSWGGIEGKV